ncbi:MAG TPA: exo-beta-N-acetylmuramidase NamZ domain-containing protein [Bryobacteraceae bacterium]|nr:exo-beta-N-acetylmuramidase NamZ domain-containing protein [Bryobacteraceae bacterium]
MKKFLLMIVFATVPFASQTSNTAPALPSPIGSGDRRASTSSTAPEFTTAATMDAIIHEAIRAGQIPGAVLVVGHKGRVVYQNVYGDRALVPVREPMTFDTVFDVASLTKVVATSSAIAKLVEDGKVRLNERVTHYLPEFQGGKSDVTVRQLLTHFSGMRPDVDLEPAWSGYETGIRLATIDRPTSLPGTRFVYSDINFVLLGEIVHRVSGKTLAEYTREKIFAPLGMTETMFQPPLGLNPRIAPTEILKGTSSPLRGTVHDPTSRYMGGIAGHAGLFSTAADLSKCAEMMLGMGRRNGVRIFSPLTVRALITPQGPADQPILRGLGWDIDSPFSGSRGDLFPVGSFGHTGFTGTSMWMDPFTDTYVILLTNAVHPTVKAAITPLRGKVASIAAAGLNLHDFPGGAYAIGGVLAQVVRPPLAARPPFRSARVLNGIDVLVTEKFASLRGKRVGLITNHTGLTRDGLRSVDAMVAGGVNLRALYSPEHGLAGKEDHENIRDTKDAATGIRVWSLYAGENRRPSDEMLRDIDTLVFDIQDVGTRFYTYTCTMAYAMEEAAKRGVEFVVLDRPNPINGLQVEGPVLKPALKSFIGCIEMPLRHGMTVGELATMVNDSLRPKAKLQVVKMRGWQRGDWFDATGLEWINPSPNMRSLNAALLYPGIGMLELAKQYSVGRGTDAPFEQIGAIWMNGQQLAEYLNTRQIPGVRFYATRLHPTASNFAGKTIDGVRFVITDREALRAVRLGFEVGSAIAKLFPGQMDWAANDRLVGDNAVLKQLEAGTDPAVIEQSTAAELERFKQQRQAFLLY